MINGAQLDFPGGQTIVLHRRTQARDAEGAKVYDDYGDVVYTNDSQTLTGIPVWTSSGSLHAESSLRHRYNVYSVVLPVDLDVHTIDFITWRGQDYELEGDPETFESPFTTTRYQTVRMTRVEV